MDMQVEELTLAWLKKLYPDISFVVEECGGNRQAEQFWLIDTIDSTSHFVRGWPFCSTMLALTNEG